MKATENVDPRVLELLDQQWTSKNDIAYRTAWKYARKGFTNTGDRAMWLTGSTGESAMEDIVQLVICHAWTLFVNLSITRPDATIQRRITAAVFVALKRVTKEGRQYREASRMATAGHQDALAGSCNTRTTYEKYHAGFKQSDGHESEPVEVSPGIPWGIEYADEQAYRIPENREAFDRIVKRLTVGNCHGHSQNDCRSYRQILRLMVATDCKTGGPWKKKVADAMGMTKETFRRRLFHIADALRQALSVNERTLPVWDVDEPEHGGTCCQQLAVQPAGPPANVIGSVNSATGHGHDWTRPGANRRTGTLGREWMTGS